jgi:hypothetical protein
MWILKIDISPTTGVGGFTLAKYALIWLIIPTFDSAVLITLRMRSPSRTIPDLYFMTQVDLRVDQKLS